MIVRIIKAEVCVISQRPKAEVDNIYQGLGACNSHCHV